MGRILDCIAGENALSQPFTVAFQPATHARALVYCRVGLAANSIRRAWHRTRTVAPVQEWFSVACWTEHLDLACPFSPSTCANAARRASEQAESDWRTECAIFRAGDASPPISEDWPDEAWERANSVPDARTAYLMAQASCLQLEGWDYAIFGDGGRVCQNCPTYSYQARSFGPVGDYWGTSSVVSDRHVGCLPLRVGWEHTGVHEAELAAMLGSLRYRRHGEWMLLVADRSALFHILNKASVGDEAVLLKQHCQPWVTRLWHILRERAASWKPGVPIPSWRLQQIELPSAWNIQLPGDADSRSKWYSRIAFSRFGLVGVDIKSHQTHTALPHPVLAQGNQQQDEGCAVARTLPRPSDIRKPAGGLVCQSHSVTSPVRDFLRKAMRKEALTKWASKPVQGLIAHVGQELFKPCLNPELYRHCHIPAPWKRWALAQDDKHVDLAPMFFRCTRSIGGSWTERLHSDADLQTLAQRWILYRGLDSVRTCPLCGRGPCTPRHVFMSCEHMRPLVDALRDSVETALTASQPSDSLIAAAAGWRSRSANLLPGVPSLEDAARWPVLSAWRWMVAIPEREAFLTEEPRGSSRDSSRRAKGHDLAYRGVIPLALGKALCSLHHSEDADHLLPPDTFATLRQPGLAADEVAASRSRASRIQPALMVNSLLLLGLRFVRSEFQQRLDAWITLARTLLDNMHPAGDPQMVPFMPGVPQPAPGLQAWLRSPEALGLITELRWLVPTQDIVVNRIRAVNPGLRLGGEAIIAAVRASGVPILLHRIPSWGGVFPEWHTVKAALQVTCTCVRHALPAPVSCCWQCGGAILLPGPPRPCRWCHHEGGDLACSGCGRRLHKRGQCRAWNRGASKHYLPGPVEPHALCPDCMWVWLQAWMDCPRRHRTAVAPDLTHHMASLAAACVCGAGSQNARSAPSLTLRRVRKWILRHLRARHPHLGTPLDMLLSRCEAAMAVPAATPLLHDLVQRSVRCLCREGKAFLTMVDGTTCIALHEHEWD